MSDRTVQDHREPGRVLSSRPFVGRETEMAWMLRRLEAAEAGHPQVVFVIGDAGIGKTRLLREFGATAHARGVEVCTGRGHDELTLPFLPMVEALAPRLRELPAPVAAALGSEAELVRQFATGNAVVPSIEPQKGDDKKLRLFLAVSRAVVELARLGPMALVLDDLHWVDQASLELFAHLVFTVADAAGRMPLPLLILGSTRPLGGERQLARTVARFQRETICQTLELGGLDEDRLRELMGSLGVEHPSQQLFNAIRGTTGGNPLFVQEIVRRLQRRGNEPARGFAGGNASLLSLPLPANVRGAIADRLREIGPDTRRLLTLAAVYGDPFRAAALSTVSGQALPAVLDVLKDACAQGLVGTDNGSFRFAHPLIRQVLYGELPAPVRQRQHADIAAALIAHGGHAGGEAALEIARHLVAAGAAADPATLLGYARRAGDLAFAGASWRDAASFYRAALSADDAAHQLEPQARAELHALAGQAHFRDQDGAPCLEQFTLALAAFAACGDLRNHAQALVGHTRAELTLAAVAYGGPIDSEPLRAAAERLADMDPALSALCWSELSQVYWTERRTTEAAAAARHALAVGERYGYHFICAEALRSLWLAQTQMMQVHEALASLEAGRTHARLWGEPLVESELVQREPLTLTWLGRLDDAEARAAVASALTLTVHDWGEHSLAQGALVCAAVARGHFAAAEEHARQALVMFRRSHYPWAAPTALPALAYAHALRERWTDATAALDLLATPGELFVEPGPAVLLASYVYRTAVEAFAAASDNTRAALAGRLGGLAGAGPTDSANVYALGVYGAVVEVADLAGDAALAATVEHPLAHAAQRGVLLSTGWVVLIARALGVVATLARDWRAAEGHFGRALAQAETMGARTELARTAFDWARMLMARGHRTDRERALTLASRAADLARDLGLVGLRRAAARLVERLGVPVIAPIPLTRREQALLERFAHGCSDREIARELGVRLDTVGRAGARLLRRLGLTHRDETRRLAGTAAPAAAAPVEGALRIIVFTDVHGSTAQFERLGDAEARAALREHDTIVRACLQRHGGNEVNYTGDGVMASFASVAAAIDFAIDVQRAMVERNMRCPDRAVRVRVGINAGEPIAEDGQLYGTSVNAAARICAQAKPGQILVADVVRSLATGKDVPFVDRGWFTLRGLPTRHHLHEVQW